MYLVFFNAVEKSPCSAFVDDRSGGGYVGWPPGLAFMNKITWIHLHTIYFSAPVEDKSVGGYAGWAPGLDSCIKKRHLKWM